MNSSLRILQQPSGARWWVFGLACAVSWLLYVHRYAWGVVKPEFQKEHQLSNAEMGWLDSLFSITYAVGQVPGGVAGDLLGARAVLPVMILSWSLCVAGLALVGGFWAIAVTRAAFGASQAGAYPILSKVTRSWFPTSVRTGIQGMVATLAGRTGAACSSILVATVLMAGLGLSWQASLYALASGGVLLAVAFWLAYRNSPREHPWANNSEVELIEEGEKPAAPGSKPQLYLGFAQLLTLGMLMLYSFASTFADQLFVFWIPSYLDDHGLSQAERGIYSSFPLWGGALGGAVGGLLNDTLIRLTGNRRWSRSVVALVGKLTAGLLVGLSVLLGDARVVMAVLFVAKFFNDWSLSTQWGTITDIGGRASGTIFGIVNSAGSVGGFVAGPVMGAIRNEGWNAMFLTVAGVFVAAGLCWLLIDCTQRLVAEADTPRN